MTQQTPPSDVARIFDAELDTDEPFVPSYNVAPTDPVTVVVHRDDGRIVERHRWGLIPAWADSPSSGARMINARVETVASSPAFRTALRRRRCIVPADGFYEWKRVDGHRLPYFLHAHSDEEGGDPHAERDGDGLLAMAGLWSVWRDPATGAWIASCAVVTAPANADVAPIHDRMPVILAREDWNAWLDPNEADPAVLSGLLAPTPDGTLAMYAVSSRVNSVRNNGPDLIVPVAATPLQAALFG